MTATGEVSNFRWLKRYPQYCVTVVEQAEPARVLAGFGVVGEEISTGGPTETAGLMAERFGYRPVVRLAAVRGWVVAIEQYSHEGVRLEVLRRLSSAGRVVAVGVSGDGMRWLGFAADGWAGRVETSAAPGDPGWDGLVELAEHASVSLAGWAADDVPANSLRFVSAVCGLAIDDEIMAMRGPIGVALPV